MGLTRIGHPLLAVCCATVLIPLVARADATRCASGPSAATIVVCPVSTQSGQCDYRGDAGIQAAIDAAPEGATVFVRAGTYFPTAFRDVPYQKLTIRGYLLIDHKKLCLAGEAGTILDGSKESLTSAIVVNGGDVALQSLTLRDFRYLSADDDIYDGHGVFVIDAHAVLTDVAIERISKMALSARGNSSVEATRLLIRDGHVGIWLEETAKLTLADSVIEGNSSAGLCAYGDSTASVERSLLASNGDDGVYTDGRARVDVGQSMLVGNRPFGARAAGTSHIRVTSSIVSANGERDSAEEGHGRVELGRGVGGVGPRSR